MFEGTHVAIVTPFKNGVIDEPALASLVRRLMDAGVSGIVPCGTTGESPTLTAKEHEAVIETVIGLADRRVKVIAGTGSNNTADTVHRTRHAAGKGADGVLLVAPYYNKPTPEGLYRHYAAVASAVEIPVVLYNVPGRCGVEIDTGTIVRLRSEFKNIVAVKHATGSMDGAGELLQRCDIVVLSGDDTMTLPLMSVGARGVISVIANLVPTDMVSMVRDALEGKFIEARRTHGKMFGLARALLSLEANPIPIKAALSMVGRIENELRLPLCPMSETNRHRLARYLTEYGLL